MFVCIYRQINLNPIDITNYYSICFVCLLFRLQLDIKTKMVESTM